MGAATSNVTSFLNNESAVNGGINGPDFIISTLSRSFFNATSNCQRSSQLTSTVDIDCGPTGPSYETTSACQLCKAMQVGLPAVFDAMQDEAIARDPSLTKQTLAPGTDWVSEFPSQDTCRFLCNACAISGTSQVNHLSMNAECAEIDASFQETMQTQMEAIIRNKLNSHAEQLERVNSGIDTGIVSAEMSSDLMVYFNTTIKVDVVASILALQEIRIEPGSESIVVSDTSQAFTIDMITSVMNRLATENNLLNQAQIEAYDEYYSDNSALLSNGAEDSLNQSLNSVADLWDSLSGRIVLIGVAVLGLAVVGIAIFMILKNKNG